MANKWHNLSTVLFFLLLTLPIYGVVGFGPIVLAMVGIPIWFVAMRPTREGWLMLGMTALLLSHSLFWIVYGIFRFLE